MDLNLIIEDIKSDRVKKVILDTDTDNEVDDQFALAYAIGASRVELLSVNAAPFSHPERNITHKMGADASYVEIGRVLEAYGGNIPYYRGAEVTIDQNGGLPVDSPAARNIIDTAMAQGHPVVLMLDNGMPDIYHPSADRIALCRQGLLLLVTPWQYHYRPADTAINVTICKAMNAVVQSICRLKDTWWKNF